MIEQRKELYIELIKKSSSLLDVCRKADIVPTTGNYNTLKRIIKENNIDISHFKRVGGYTTSTIKKETYEYLCYGSNINSFRLKNKLLKDGYKEHKCEKCGLTEWNGLPIPLELHHINGDNTDNRIENLQMLCPNCHAFTETYGGKNQKLNILKKQQKENNKTLNENEKNEIIFYSQTIDSIQEIANKTKHTQRTVKKVLTEKNISINKINKIKTDNDLKIPLILESLKQTKSFSGTAREFGVSDNAIKKLLVRRGYPGHIKELLQILLNENIV